MQQEDGMRVLFNLSGLAQVIKRWSAVEWRRSARRNRLSATTETLP
jgi:hypothetical protein